jgi:hypothetical protein
MPNGYELYQRYLNNSRWVFCWIERDEIGLVALDALVVGH